MIPWESQGVSGVEERRMIHSSRGALRSHDHPASGNRRGGTARRRLQSGGGAVMLESLTFFAIVMAFALAVWLCCRISLRATRRVIRRTEPEEGAIDAVPGAHMEEIDWYTLQQRARARAGLPRGTGASSWFGAPTFSREQRRAFLEQALLRQKYAVEAKSKPERVPMEDDESGEENKKACAICLEEYAEGDEVCRSCNRRCKHVFHRNCIMDWLMKDETCPCCRQIFVAFHDGENGPVDSSDTGLDLGARSTDDAATTAQLSRTNSSPFPSSQISSGWETVSLSSLFLGPSRHSSVGALELAGGADGECDPTSEAADPARTAST